LRAVTPAGPSRTPLARRFRLVALASLGVGGLAQAGPTPVPDPPASAPSAPANPSPAPPPVLEGLALAQPERVYLAQIEQRGLVLTRRGWPALAKAIRAGVPAGVATILAADFQGTTLDVDEGKGPRSEMIDVRRVAPAAGAPPRAALSAEAFATFLVDLRKRFTAPAAVEMALMSLSPLERTSLDGAWKGSCALRIVGSATSGGVAELMCTMEFELASVPDADAIAKAPGWIRRLRMTVMQLSRAPHALFEETGWRWGIDKSRFDDTWLLPAARKRIVTGGVFLADVDDDGCTDVLVTDLRGIFLFRGSPGGKFTDVTEASGLPAKMSGVSAAAWADFDGDGRVDLMLPTRLYRNAGDLRFEDVTARSSLALGAGLSALCVADYDGDGRIDVYASRTDPGIVKSKGDSWIDGPGGPGNQLWRNLGDWKFEDVSAKAGASAGHRSTFTSAWLDANDDGRPDVYVLNEFGGGVLLVNQGDGTFRETPLLEDAGDFGSMGMAVGDVDNDGHVDVYTANMYSKAGRRIMENLAPDAFPPAVFTKMKRFVTGSELYHNDGGLKFTRVGKAARVHSVGWAYGAAFFDLDNDGFLDLYGTAGFVSVNKDEPDG